MAETTGYMEEKAPELTKGSGCTVAGRRGKLLGCRRRGSIKWSVVNNGHIR